MRSVFCHNQSGCYLVEQCLLWGGQSQSFLRPWETGAEKEAGHIYLQANYHFVHQPWKRQTDITWLNLGIISNFTSNIPMGTLASAPTPLISTEQLRRPFDDKRISRHARKWDAIRVVSPDGSVFIRTRWILSDNDSRVAVSAIFPPSFCSSSKKPAIENVTGKLTLTKAAQFR